MRLAAAVILLCATAGESLPAQLAAPTTPAAALAGFKQSLDLTDAQMARLRTLDSTQLVALSRARAAFMRAEADVVDANRGDDLVLLRTALEKRAKLAIDGEVARRKGEKDAKAILTPAQMTRLAEVAGGSWSYESSRSPSILWQSLVEPGRIVAMVDPPADSGEVRLSVTPNYADIFINGYKVGTGRRFLGLPVGQYEVRFQATGCDGVNVRIPVKKNEATIHSQSLTCR